MAVAVVAAAVEANQIQIPRSYSKPFGWASLAALVLELVLEHQSSIDPLFHFQLENHHYQGNHYHQIDVAAFRIPSEIPVEPLPKDGAPQPSWAHLVRRNHCRKRDFLRVFGPSFGEFPTDKSD